MPIVLNPESATDTVRGNGVNDHLRRMLFPDLPPTECIDGYVFFPWGTGPCFPIFCDTDFAMPSVSQPGVQFVSQPGSQFAKAVAQLGGVSLENSRKEVARAAGVRLHELDDMTVRQLGRKILERALPNTKVKHTNHASSVTVRDYFELLAALTIDLDAGKAVKDLAAQTGLSTEALGRLPLRELGAHLDVVGAAQTNPVARVGGSTVCVTANGQTRCGQVYGWAEGAMWGGIIGGAIGGGLGAAIGAVIGGIIGWLLD